jgi:hypothetical protein
MPIEDVDYLKQVSTKQSYMFLVDSADRTRATYPTPSEYVVDFTTPFQKVVGLEVVDASIPRTMYNIDSINNRLTFYIHSVNIDPSTMNVDTIPWKTVEIPLGDYTIQTLVAVLNEVLVMNLDDNTNHPSAAITVETTTNPPDIQSTLRFRCPYPFFLAMGKSTVAESLGFDLFTQTSEATKPILEQRYTAPFQQDALALTSEESKTSPITRMYHSVDVDPSIAMSTERIVFDGPRGVLRKIPVDTLTKKVAQRFYMSMDGYLTQVYAALTTPEGSVSTSPVHWQVFASTSPNPPDITTTSPIAQGTIAISFIDGGLSDSNIVREFLEGGKYYWLVLFVTTTVPVASVYYNDVLDSESSLFVSSDSGSSWNVAADSEGIFYQMCARIIVKDRYHVVTAPGIYSLIGPRYIVLRCPEIEENSFRSLAYSKHHLGLAKFRLGVVGYSDNRMDFSKVPLREFHPIGRLNKLTLRFELPSGELYNFRGINHTITFAIHYYEPLPRAPPKEFLMNPNYNPDFIKYMYLQEDQEGDSDDQSEELSRDRMMDYRQAELMYLPDNVRLRDLQQLYDRDFDPDAEDDS